MGQRTAADGSGDATEPRPTPDPTGTGAFFAVDTSLNSEDTGAYFRPMTTPAVAATTSAAAAVMSSQAQSEAIAHEAERRDEAERTGVFTPVSPDAKKQRRKGLFRALQVRNYRLYFSGNVISQTGTWMNRVAQDWLVLQLTDDDPVALGIATGLQFGPLLFLSLFAGTVADRYDKRRMLIILQSILGAAGVALGLLATLNVATVWYVYAACLLVGLAAAFDGPVRQAFIMELVGRDQVSNAVALNSMGFNGARIVGPAVAGVLIAVIDSGPVMMFAGFGYVAVIISLARMRDSELFKIDPIPRERGQIRAGIRYVMSRRDLRMIMLLVFMVSTFGMNFQLTLAIMAKIVFERDAAFYGLLTTTLAVGSLAGALMSARRQDAPRLRLLVGAAIAFGAIEIVMGVTSSYVLLAVLLVPGGMLMLLFINAANAALQLTTSVEMRGRVMSIYILVFLGGTPFIAPVLGIAAEKLGGGSPLWLGGGISLVSAIVLGIWIGRSANMHLQLRIRPIPHLHVYNPLAPDEENVSASVARTAAAIADSARSAVEPAASQVLRAGRMVGRTVRRPGRGPRGGGRR